MADQTRRPTPADFATDQALFAASRAALAVLGDCGMSFPPQGHTDTDIAAYLALVAVQAFAENGGSVDAYRSLGTVAPSWTTPPDS
ncbi:hypothetical protein MKK75_06565 [Methylobacterium sp. J-030]|uniref:hypothetical protein n=1 Tax=Methylobacterium sp. J-030 TaxID=2836627 RepID=UPI001FB88268|nr:hypothetical protein [Methylobacterium sp. J-030]MCJ2068471.1 hypothetical protein [Methylobacterium sp. J-030]